jgi:radical SAM protein with 4Fe4S-binding SPASM domain
MALSRDLRNLYRRKRIPYSAHLDLTWRCPLNCVHCYVSGRSRSRPEMTCAQIVEVLEGFSRLGTMNLLLSGGEILLRPDLGVILDEAHKRRFRLTLKTTGVGMASEQRELFARIRPHVVQVSLYSHLAEIHDVVTRRPGAFTASLELLLWLRREGIAAEPIVTPLAGYCEDVKPTLAGLEELGVPPATLNSLDVSLCATRDIGALELGTAVRRRLLRDYWNPEASERRSREPEDTICAAGWSGLYVEPDGTARPCLPFPEVAGNVAATSVAEVWRDSPLLEKLRSLRWRDLGQCFSCADKPFCSFCIADALKQTGQMTGRAPAVCAAARLKREVAEERQASGGALHHSRGGQAEG